MEDILPVEIGYSTLQTVLAQDVVEPGLKDRMGNPFLSDVICNLSIGRTAFYHHISKERIRELGG